MKAIIISDEEAKSLISSLTIQSMRDCNIWGDKENQTEDQIKNSIHRAFHYVVVQWLQKMGANLQ